MQTGLLEFAVLHAQFVAKTDIAQKVGNMFVRPSQPQKRVALASSNASAMQGFRKRTEDHVLDAMLGTTRVGLELALVCHVRRAHSPLSLALSMLISASGALRMPPQNPAVTRF